MVKCGRGGMLTIQLHLANSLRMSGAKPPFYTCTAWTGTGLPSLALRWSNAQCTQRNKGSKLRRTDYRNFYFFFLFFLLLLLLLERLALCPLWSSNSELTSDKWWHSVSTATWMADRVMAKLLLNGEDKRNTHKKAPTSVRKVGFEPLSQYPGFRKQ